MRVVSKIQALLRPAEEKYLRLLERARPGNTKWHPRAWGMIERRLKDEAQFILECDVTAICTYTLYVEVAYMYLLAINDLKAMKRFLTLVRADIAEFGAVTTRTPEPALDDDEKKLVACAMQTLVHFIDQLRARYPDTE